jgi:hypothetical protein
MSRTHRWTREVAEVERLQNFHCIGPLPVAEMPSEFVQVFVSFSAGRGLEIVRSKNYII